VEKTRFTKMPALRCVAATKARYTCTPSLPTTTPSSTAATSTLHHHYHHHCADFHPPDHPVNNPGRRTTNTVHLRAPLLEEGRMSVLPRSPISTGIP
jgi:hypothetical protein